MRQIFAAILLVSASLSWSTGCNLYSELDRPEGDPVADLDGGDVGSPDGGEVDSGECTPQSDLDFCQQEGADCGEVTGFDNCGTSRNVNCGSCTDGSTCGERQENVCGCPCEIEGTCIADGAINPDNACEACDPLADDMGWTPRTGASCSNGDLCAIAAACSDQGVCETTQAVDCSEQVDECIDATCDPADGVCKGDPRDDGTPCSDDGLACTDDICQAGVCEHPTEATSCVADGVCLADGESPSGNDCVTCVVTDGTAALVNASAGTACGPTLSCAMSACDGSGACITAVDTGTCAIDGTCYNDGDRNPTNRCEYCVAATSQTDWTPEPAGTECRAPNCRCGTSPFGGDFTCLRPNDADCN